MVASTLNLARKWRSKHFNEVVGQELPIRMLQNSLYIGHIFPVYLFSGQRGCGKTTTARLFASALNCFKLQEFRKNPKLQTIPCLECESCLAMAQGSHPDFIEIDAASHTGVDNVRQVIDAASLLPVMGTKRVYLIDEAHMLSKAAFNAFLKILEEPPASVVFMLATTDPQKILETVRSRCFQLFFNSIDATALVKHLHDICVAENIQCEESALQIIVQETEGSARDALNLLEQVRFSHATVSQSAVLAVLGHMTETLLLDLFQSIIEQNIEKTLALVEEIKIGKYAPVLVWQKLQEVIRIVLSLKNKVAITVHYNDKERLHRYAKQVSMITLIRSLQILFDYEMTLLKSTSQDGVLQLMIITMTSPSYPIQGGFDKTNTIQQQSHQEVVSFAKIEKVVVDKNTLEQTVVTQPEQASAPSQDDVNQEWAAFLASVDTLSDPLLRSIFKQGQWRGYDASQKIVTIAFPLETKFFGEWLHETKSIWLPLLQAVFGAQTEYQALFESGITPQAEIAKTVDKSNRSSERNQQSTQSESPSNNDTQKRYQSHSTFQNKKTVQQSGALVGKKIDVSDKETWKTTHALLDAFGGTVVEIDEQHKQE